VDALFADLRFALRQFARRPGTTLTMFVVLAVGMSISTLLFSFVHSYAVRPPPGIALRDDLVRIRGSRTDGAGGRYSRTFSEDEFLGYRGLTGRFGAVAGWVDETVPLDAGGDAERRGLEARATFVTENYFSVLGVRPVLGPGLPSVRSDDPATAAVAVLGHAAWDQLFGRSPDVIGSTLTVNGVRVTVVGVAPERFTGARGLGGHSSFQLWMPLPARRLVVPEPPGAFRAAGRLRPGVGPGAATAAVRVVAARTAATDEEVRALDPSTDVVPLLAANGDPMFDQDVRLMSLSVGLLGLLVLLVACTNVSALLTGLATARRQEIAIRLSLGAARTRLIRQLLTESALLATAAGAAALGIVWTVLRAVTRLVPLLPFEMGITWPATAFTFGVALAVGILFGLSPALHATRLAVASALQDSGGAIAGARARLQRGLVVAQIAFTQPLVVLLAAVLLVVLGEYRPRSRNDFGDRLITLSLRLPAGSGTGQQLRATTARLADRLRATPGVEAAVVDWGGGAPLGAYVVHPGDRVAGALQSAIRLSGERAAEGHFRVMDIPLLRGREFAPGDAGSVESRTEAPVIVGADLARRLWAGADPVGRRLRAAGDSVKGAGTLVVVGVVDDPLAETRRAGEDYRVYLPPDTGRVPASMLLRTAGAAQPLVPAVRSVLQEEAPGMVARVRTLAEIEEEERRNFRLATGGVSAAGVMALLLSAVGLYAVVAFSVGQRTREIAVRIAVGARARQIARSFVADGLRLSALGLAFGLPLSLIGLRTLTTTLDGVPPVALGPVTAIAALGVGVVATAAAWIPARRAASVDPAVTLRGG
ncbi:MAG TPA: ABC transporter permease, partial [Longimicrobiaceae bacterium]